VTSGRPSYLPVLLQLLWHRNQVWLKVSQTSDALRPAARPAKRRVAGRAASGNGHGAAADGGKPRRWIRILLVEDEADDAELLTREIERGGFQPFMQRVDTAKKARACLEAEEWDLLISDDRLPGSGGQEVLAELRASGIDLPFILVSGKATDRVAVATMHAGASDYVPKGNLARLVPAMERELMAANTRAARALAERAALDFSASLLAETTSRARRFEILHELATAASGLLEETALGKLAVDRAAELLDADIGVLRWFDATTGLMTRMASNDPNIDDRTLNVLPSETVVGRAFVLDAPVSLNRDRLEEGRVPGDAHGVAAVAAVPVRSAGKAVGALAVMRYQDHPFRADEVELLTLLAGLVGPAIEAARLHGQLAATEGRIRGIYEALPCGVVVETADGVVIEVNRMARKLFGEAASVELLATGHMDATYTDSAGQELDPTQRPWMPGLEGHHPQAIGITIAGREPLRLITESTQSADGAGTEIVVTSFIDMTALKQAEAALAESQALFRTAFEGAPGGVAVLSPDGHYLRTNQTMTDILGYSPEEFRELTNRDIIHPHDWALRDAIAHPPDRPGAKTSSPAPIEVRNIRKDGVTIWVSLKVSTTRDESGQIRNYITQVAEVTEQRLANEQLERIRVQLDQAQEIGSIGTWTYWMKAGEVRLACSGGLLKILGLPPDFSGSLAALATLVHPDDMESARRAYESAVNDGGSDARHRIVRDGGEVRWIDQKLALIRDELGAPSYILGVTRDVTEEYLSGLSARQDREMLSKVLDNAPVALFAIDRYGTPTLAEGKVLTTFGLTTELARTVNVFDVFAQSPEVLHHIRAALAGESFAGEIELPGLGLWFDSRYEPMYDHEGQVVGLSGIATDISDRIQAKRAREDSESRARVAAMMNHEVRTPLNSVLGFAELLNMERVGPLNPTQKRYLSNIETAGRHLLSLINESLDLAKLAAGQMGAELKVITVAPVLTDVTAKVEPMVDLRDLELRLLAPPDLRVRADPRHLVQVLYNLLSNAIKHSPKGGVITMEASREGGSVLISIKDQGGGIAAVDLDRIFIEFVTLNSGAEGTGLGLTISRKLAELMGGALTVTSEVGMGSVFTLTLPSAEPAERSDVGRLE